MAKGANAKVEVEKIIKEAFGSQFVGNVDKKIYVWADDGNGVKVQIAMSLTCPKVEVGTKTEDENGVVTSETQNKKFDITDEEQEKVKVLMNKLGLK